MKWAATNTLGAGAWLLGIFYAKAPHIAAFGSIDGVEHRMVVAVALTAIGAVILLWANLRSAA